MQLIEGSRHTMTMPKRTPFINAYVAITGLVAVPLLCYFVHPAIAGLLTMFAIVGATRGFPSIWATMEETSVVETYVDDGSDQLRAEAEAVIRRIEESNSVFLKTHTPTLRQLVELRAQLAIALQRLNASPVDVRAIENHAHKIEVEIKALDGSATETVRASLRQQKQLIERQRLLFQQRETRVRHMKMEIGRIDLQVAVLRDEVNLHGNNEEAMIAGLNELTRLTEETSTWIAENADLDRPALGKEFTSAKTEHPAVQQ